MLKSHAGQKLFSFAMAAILGGAIGNVVDRHDARLRGRLPATSTSAGRHFPAFNVADSAITVGAICLMLDELRRMRRK